MVFVSILSLLPSGLVLQSLVSPYNCQWSVEDHILIAAPLSIWSAWCVPTPLESRERASLR